MHVSYTQTIIIGAPRSGTNMLRDALTNISGISTWPCDEINYIWRHGNIWLPTDEIPAERASEKVRAYIRKRFDEVQIKESAKIVVEKTCANSLRVPFVESVLPAARYIYIYRDGIDAVSSAKLRWRATLDINYLWRKLQYVPVIDMPVYAIRYLWSRVYKIFSRDRRLAYWGPRFYGMQAALQAKGLSTVCALQWQRCVEKAEDALMQLPSDRVISVSYERFVREPDVELERILKFLGHQVDRSQIITAVREVSATSVGKGRARFTGDELSEVESIIDNTRRKISNVV